jgi:hypothetical protein
MNTTFPLSGITFGRQQLFNSIDVPKTLPGKRDKVSPYEQNKIFG